MRDSRYRRILERAFRDEEGTAAAGFMAICMQRWNARTSPEEHISSIDIERHVWDFKADPDNPNYGELVETRSYPAPSD
jgi:hypothetical protein